MLKFSLKFILVCILYNNVFSSGIQGINTSFGLSGSVLLAGNKSKLVSQSDGKLIVFTERDKIYRLNPDGSRDLYFKNPGYLPGSGTDGYNIIVLNNDKILLLQNNSIFDRKIYLTLLKRNGEIDSTFGQNGVRLINTRGSGLVTNMELTSSNGVLISYCEDTTNTTGLDASMVLNHVLLKIKENGSNDSSFGINGKVLLSKGDLSNTTFCKVRNDGKIVTRHGILNTNGSIYTIGSNYLLNTPHGEGNSFAVLPDNKIIILRQEYLGYIQNTYISRLNSDGTLDNTFGANGSRLLFNKSQPFVYLLSDVGILYNKYDNSIYAGISERDTRYTYTEINSTLYKININGIIDSVNGCTFPASGLSGEKRNFICQSKSMQSMTILKSGEISIIIKYLGANSSSFYYLLKLSNTTNCGTFNTQNNIGIRIDTTYAIKGTISNTNRYYDSILTLKIGSHYNIINPGIFFPLGTPQWSNSIPYINGLSLDNNDKFIMSCNDSSISRFNSNGFIDSLFGINGCLYINNKDPLTNLPLPIQIIQPLDDGRIIIGGYFRYPQWHCGYIRYCLDLWFKIYDTNQQIVQSFGVNGLYKTNLKLKSDRYDGLEPEYNITQINTLKNNEFIFKLIKTYVSNSQTFSYIKININTGVLTDSIFADYWSANVSSNDNKEINYIVVDTGTICSFSSYDYYSQDPSTPYNSFLFHYLKESGTAIGLDYQQTYRTYDETDARVSNAIFAKALKDINKRTYLVGGLSYLTESGSQSKTVAIIARLNNKGNLDTTFSYDGIFRFPFEFNRNGYSEFSLESSIATDILILNNGKILITGLLKATSEGQLLFTTQLLENGKIDSTYGFNGFLFSKFDSNLEFISAEFTTNGQILTKSYYNIGSGKISLIQKYFIGSSNTVTDIKYDINKENDKIIVYPNPTSSELNLILPKGKGTLVVYDLNGNKIISNQIESQFYNINISNLNSGLYIIVFNNDNNYYTAKFVKI